jgi:hypothetical protein
MELLLGGFNIPHDLTSRPGYGDYGSWTQDYPLAVVTSCTLFFTQVPKAYIHFTFHNVTTYVIGDKKRQFSQIFIIKAKYFVLKVL